MRLPIYKKKVVILLKKVDRMVDSDVEDDGGKEGRENDPTLGWSSRSYQKEAGTIESQSKHLVQIQSASGITPRQNALSRTGKLFTNGCAKNTARKISGFTRGFGG